MKPNCLQYDDREGIAHAKEQWFYRKGRRLIGEGLVECTTAGLGAHRGAAPKPLACDEWDPHLRKSALSTIGQSVITERVRAACGRGGARMAPKKR